MKKVLLALLVLLIVLTVATTAYAGTKVAVCHNGHTIYVSENAVPAHLKHGDTLGECPSTEYDNIIYLPFLAKANPCHWWWQWRWCQ